MTKKKKLKGDEYTHIIYPSYSHRIAVDDLGEPIKVPHLNKRKRKYATRPMRQFLGGYHLDLHNILHPEERVSPEPVVEAEAKRPPSLSNQQKYRRRIRRRAEKHKSS